MRPIVAAAVLTLLAAVALTIAVAAADTPMRGEARLLREVQAWPFPGDALSDVIRALTTTWLVLVLGSLFAAGLAVTGARREALVLLGMLFVLAWWQPALKNLVDRPRPAGDVVDVRGSVTSESFPAGHVMGPTVLYGYAIVLGAVMRWPRALRAGVVAVSVALLVLTGLVNIWLGVHWPSDVAGAYLWGAAIVLAGVCTLLVLQRVFS